MKLWKISERERRVCDGEWNTRDEAGHVQENVQSNAHVGNLRIPKLVPMQLVVEVMLQYLYVYLYLGITTTCLCQRAHVSHK